jgi:hypothetical protein
VLAQAAAVNDGKFSLTENNSFSFHTPYLNLVDSEIYWAKHANGSIEVRFNLTFNYTVNPMEVANLLRIQVAGKEIPLK